MRGSAIRALSAALAIAFAAALLAPARADGPQYAIAMHGDPALPKDFDRLPYASKDAVKGGRLRLAEPGAFDSLNPYNVKAMTAAEGLTGNVYQTLMYRSADEPFTLYGLIAQSLETNAARDFVVFHLDPRAHFSDRSPITSADVLFSFELLKTKGHPPIRAAYGQVKSAVAPDAETVQFDLAGSDDRELPLMLALMPVLSHVRLDVDRFAEPTLDVPIGSGPYRVTAVDPGRSLTLSRDPNYWARDLPIMKGLYNFDEIQIDYYRDANAMFEAFKAGLYDFRLEDDANRWTTGYRFPAAADGRVIVTSIPDGLPKGVTGFAFNTRRPLFADRAVREALAGMFDFEWINANLFAGVYRRSTGFFDGSELSSVGRPAGSDEMALLAPFANEVSAAALAGSWRPPVSDGSGRDRAQAERALAELARAGFGLRDGVMRGPDGAPLRFEILVKRRIEERLALAYARSLARIGAQASVRLVDETQFQRRRDRFDFDMAIGSWPATPSPGGEQRGRWGSAAASQEGSYNLAGVRSAAIDAMIEKLVASASRQEFVAAARSLDRLLISGAYIMPLYYAPELWVAYRSTLARPSRDPLFGVALESWWSREP